MISYDPLWITLVRQKKKKGDLYSVLSSATVARMAKNATNINLREIDKICALLGCRVDEVIEYIPD